LISLTGTYDVQDLERRSVMVPKMEKQVEVEVCPNREKNEEKLKSLLNRSEKSVKI